MNLDARISDLSWEVFLLLALCMLCGFFAGLAITQLAQRKRGPLNGLDIDFDSMVRRHRTKRRKP